MGLPRFTSFDTFNFTTYKLYNFIYNPAMIDISSIIRAANSSAFI